jgi:hypothetical protein
MATIDSAGTGNFSDGATWVGGVVPGASDVARVLTGHTVTIDGNVTCQELRKDGSNTQHSGNFVLGGTHTVTADITNACTGSNGSALVNFTLNSGTATIIGNVTGGTGTNHRGILGAGTGTLAITGDVTAGSGTASHGVELTGATTVCTVTGNLTGGSNTSGTSHAIVMTGASAQLTVTGNVTGGSDNTARGVSMTGVSAQLTVTGNVTAGSAAGAQGISITGASSNADIVGTLTASTTEHALTSSNQVVLDGEFIDAANGRLSHTAVLRRVRIGTNVRTVYTTPEVNNADGSPVVRASLDYVTNNVPVPGDVREGLVYADDQFTGELAVPPTESVAAGVPVDDTVGTATLNIDVVGALFEAFENPNA